MKEAEKWLIVIGIATLVIMCGQFTHELKKEYVYGKS